MIATGRAAAVLAASWDPSIIWTGVYLAGALLVGALAIELYRRYMRREGNSRLSASDQLAQFRSLYEQGALSEEEFNRLRSLLGGELLRSARKPVPANDASPVTPQTPDGIQPANGQTPRPDRQTPPETGIKPA
jgi:Short C-terminal domain